MRTGLVVFLSTLLWLAPHSINALAQTDTDVGFHISDVGEFYAIHKYPTLKSHKALAVGPGAVWGSWLGAPSAAIASKRALNSCNGVLRASKSKSLARQRCVLFDVDGRRTGKATPVGIPFGTIAEGEDRPWKYGKSWNATGPVRHGTMLLIHGCNKYVINGWMMSWVNYYRAAGFRVILPDSFAEQRDPELCGHPGENGAEQQARIVKLRAAQTLRTINGIRKKYPGELLYLHGHSEGGFIVQAMGEKVDGIIVTGTYCGFGSSGAYWVGKGVPVLVVAGTRDPAIEKAQTAKEFSRFCRDVTGAGRMTWTSVVGMGHYAAIWWPPVHDAIGKFLKVSSLKVARRPADGIPYPKLPAEEQQRYEEAKGHKTIAASSSGAWAWNSEEESRLDAEEGALFDCDEFATRNPFLSENPQHECTLVDVDGKRLVK
jgi:dienelactone hydrolase